MKSKKNLFLIGVCLMFVFGCTLLGSIQKPKDVFPESFGKYKITSMGNGGKIYYLNDKNKKDQYRSWDSTYSDGSNQFFYRVGIHEDATAAQNEQEFLADCVAKEVWKKAALKDKSGKEIGAITICRSAESGKEKSVLGGFQYSLGVSNDKQTFGLRTYSKNVNADMIEFFKALPINSQVDLAVLDELLASKPDKSITADELQKMSPPVKAAAKPYLKGKIVVVESASLSTGNYITDELKRATAPDEIGSIVQISCEKGKKIGDYMVKGEIVPAYGSTCKVAVIDNTIPAIIAQKTFTNRELPKTTTFTSLNGQLTSQEYVAPYPIGEIKTYIQSLPKN